MKKVILIILALGVIGGLVGLYMFNKKVPTLDSVEADFSLTPDELYDAFDQNEADATSKYQGKVIEVKGSVARTKQDESQLNVILQAQNSMTGGVNCSMRDLTQEAPAKGDVVTIRGECQGYLMDVVLNNCVIIEK